MATKRPPATQEQRREWARIGERIKRRADILGWTLADLADRSGVSQPYLSRLAKGGTHATLAIYQAIAQAMYMSLEQMVGEGPLPGEEGVPDRRPVSLDGGDGNGNSNRNQEILQTLRAAMRAPGFSTAERLEMFRMLITMGATGDDRNKMTANENQDRWVDRLRCINHVLSA